MTKEMREAAIPGVAKGRNVVLCCLTDSSGNARCRRLAVLQLFLCDYLLLYLLLFIDTAAVDFSPAPLVLRHDWWNMLGMKPITFSSYISIYVWSQQTLDDNLSSPGQGGLVFSVSSLFFFRNSYMIVLVTNNINQSIS